MYLKVEDFYFETTYVKYRIAMSEEKSRFRIKKGDIEIEYQGPQAEVKAKYEEALQWIKGERVTPTESRRKRKKGKIEKAKRQKSTGIPAEVDKLTDEGILDDYKRPNYVIKELEKRAVYGATNTLVDGALRKRVGKTLERKKDENGKWVYRKMKESGG